MQVRFQAELFPELPEDGGGGDYLTDGRTYEVVEVYTDRKRTTLRLVSDDGTPALYDARCFVTVDDSLPGDWRVEVTDQGITLGPEEFLKPGFWEAYFDRAPIALELFERRHPRASWSQLDEQQYELVWATFETRYEFRTGTTEDSWPGIREPEDSVTFDLAPVFANEEPMFAAAEDAINAEALRAFVSALPDKTLYALDWQHSAYKFIPSHWAVNPDPVWNVPVFPNGDYYAFFTEDFDCGTFGHPWEQSLCVIGKPLVDTLGASLATWLPVLRRGEWADWRRQG